MRGDSESRRHRETLTRFPRTGCLSVATQTIHFMKSSLALIAAVCNGMHATGALLVHSRYTTRTQLVQWPKCEQRGLGVKNWRVHTPQLFCGMLWENEVSHTPL